MRIAFTTLIFAHALIHLLGFIKGFGFKEIKELTLAISKPMGLVWLLAFILLAAYGALYMLNSKYAGYLGLLAVVISQVLLIMYWKDAKWGTLPNLFILIVSILSLAQHRFTATVETEIADLLRHNGAIEPHILKKDDVHRLPAPVKNWLLHSGAVGKPVIQVGKITQRAEMKMKPDQEKWMAATATQYTTIDSPGFIWQVKAQMNKLLSFQGRDKFQDGHGEMLIKMNALIKVVHERGPKLDEGTLQRFLGEMVWFPSMALCPYITWEAIDGTRAKAIMTYKGTTGSGIFHFSAAGDVVKFSALRFKGNDASAQRREWIMDISGYRTFQGIKVPSKMTSTWKLNNADWTWLRLEVTDLNYNDEVKL